MSHFDSAANDWDTPEKITFFESLSNSIKEKIQLPQNARVLDFGSGTGLFGLNFLTKDTELVGVPCLKSCAQK